MNYCDFVSSVTHLGTAVWAAFATLILLKMTRGHGRGRLAVGVYGLTMVLLYAASGTFHLLMFWSADPSGPRLDAVANLWVAQRLDKSAIFLLIAGSYTPVFVYLMSGAWRRWSLRVVWGIAAAGVGAVWLWPGHPHELLVGVYVGMGVAGLVAVPHYFRDLGWDGLGWIAALCTAYVGGAVAEVAKWPTLVPGWVGPHEILHVSDIVGTLIHFAFVVKFLIPRPPPIDPPAQEVADEAFGGSEEPAGLRGEGAC